MAGDLLGPVLDASALLAYLQDETGSQVVEAALATRPVINVVNYAEVLSRQADTGDEPESVHRQLQAQGLIGDLVRIVPLDEVGCISIARLRALTLANGLSLGGRACIATALRLGWPVITADRAWEAVDVDVTIRLIRS